MKLFNKLAVATVGLVLGFSGIQGEANAASLEMITNGEFEQTEFTKDWTATDNVPGWETTRNRSNGKIELWNQGKMSSPAMGSDGLGTGKHMETNFNGIDIISQTFTLGENIDTTALFSLDAWSRKGGTGTVSVQDSVTSPHIDQVSLSVNELPASVPEPASILGLLAVGAFGTTSTLKRKKKQEA